MLSVAAPGTRLSAVATVAVGLAAWLAGCDRGPVQSALDVAQPAGWDSEFALTEATDVNPDPDIVEIELDARITPIEFIPGKPTPVWAYNGSLPGPLIRAKVGDEIIVRFTNSLPAATSIHWHGMRLPNDMDGVPGLTQPPIEPGGDFVYRFQARDAGTFWYHPHINSAAQVGWGLYGALVVEDPDDPDFGDELIVVLSDMAVDEDGQFQPEDTGGEFGDLFGREGNLLLVNGRLMPTLTVRAGKPQRWRVINAARARYFSLRIPDHTFTKLGGDNGLAARSFETPRVVLVPGERADVVFTPRDAPGHERIVQWIPTERGFGSVFNRPREDLFRIATLNERPVIPPAVPESLREIQPIDISAAKHLTLDLTIDSARSATHGGTEVVMGINGIPYWQSTPLEARIGETQVWTVVNDTAFAHPFHLHGYFFQVLDDSRVPEWKDTVDVPAGETIDIAIAFDERPGMWMYHCHILDHADSGMMGHLWVAAEGETQAPHVELIH